MHITKKNWTPSLSQLLYFCQQTFSVEQTKTYWNKNIKKTEFEEMENAHGKKKL